MLSQEVYYTYVVHGFCDAGTRLLFIGTQGLNKELARLRGTEGKTECRLVKELIVDVWEQKTIIIMVRTHIHVHLP